MNFFSKDEILSKFVENAYASLIKNGYQIDPESFKEINYGLTFKVFANPKSKKGVSIALYHTEKKGVSVVTKDEILRSLLLSLLTSIGTVGCDEAGKGDLFGPLVAVSFLLGERETELLKLGIKDSKRIKNGDIIKIYERVAANFSDAFSMVRIMPERYNAFYLNLKEKGRNYNDMLAWAHSKALGNLLAKRSDAKRILVDKFSVTPQINSVISAAAGAVPINFQVRAEQNPAVAVASIIARAGYLFSLKQLEETVLEKRFKLISGSGAESDLLLNQIAAKFGKDVLPKICKTNFANCKRALQ